MLSPGKWHLEVPRDAKGNLAFRRLILDRTENDKALRKDLTHACKNDILFYVNVFVSQFNPRRNGKEVGPFITWDFQDEALLRILHHIDVQQDLVMEKSREMGATWLCLLAMDWMCKFHPWKKFLCVSRNAEAVDKPNDPDSLFWKLDFITEYQPEWLRPKIDRLKFSITYANGSNITGQASNPTNALSCPQTTQS